MPSQRLIESLCARHKNSQGKESPKSEEFKNANAFFVSAVNVVDGQNVAEGIFDKSQQPRPSWHPDYSHVIFILGSVRT